MATHKAHLARARWHGSLRVATAKALMCVIVLVGMVMFGLWVWQAPPPPAPIYGIPYHCDHSGRLPC